MPASLRRLAARFASLAAPEGQRIPSLLTADRTSDFRPADSARAMSIAEANVFRQPDYFKSLQTLPPDSE